MFVRLEGVVVFVGLCDIWRVGERVAGRVMTAERVRAQRWVMMIVMAWVERGIVECSDRL